MLGKLVAGVMGSRIAENAGKSGAVGAAAGLLARGMIRRSPIGALMLGGAWMGHKLYKRNKERQLDAAANTAKPAKVVEPRAPEVPSAE